MRWALSWALYVLGDLVSRWNDDDRRFTDTGYRLYQWLMCASNIVQRGDSGPWRAASGTPTRRAETVGSVGEADGGPTLEEGDAQ